MSEHSESILPPATADTSLDMPQPDPGEDGLFGYAGTDAVEKVTGSQVEPEEDSGSTAEDLDAEKNIGFGSNEELHTAAQWSECLLTGIPGSQWKFDGDVDNAAELLAAFSRGKHYVHTKLSKKGVPISVPPTIILTRNTTEVGGGAAAHVYNPLAKTSHLCINAHWLSKLSRYNPGEVITIRHPDGVIAFQGPARDYYEVTGAEEMRHSVSAQLGRSTGEFTPEEVSLMRYDSSEVEWHGLRWQYMCARAHELHDETQAVLLGRLRMAREFRRLQKRLT